MPSSTSNSNKLKTRTRRGIATLCIFCLTFVLIFAGGKTAISSLDALKYVRPVETKVELEDNEWFVVLKSGKITWDFNVLKYDHNNHMIMYHGIGQSIKNVKKADILFLGNSRALFAFHHEELKRFAEKHNLKIFNMAFANGEAGQFPWEILKKHHIKPKMVIVNADLFFTKKLSIPAKNAMNINLPESFDWESIGFLQTLKSYHQKLSRLFPHFIPSIPLPKMAPSAFLRSVKTGGWVGVNRPNTMRLVNLKAGMCDEVKPEHLTMGQQFKAFISERGGSLVFTYVPSVKPWGTRNRAIAFSKKLGVPFAGPTPKHLRTCDGSHLNEESSIRFTKAFLKQLENLKEFKDLANP